MVEVVHTIAACVNITRNNHNGRREGKSMPFRSRGEIADMNKEAEETIAGRVGSLTRQTKMNYP